MPSNRALPKQAASFIETMDCLPVSKLPDGPEWTYEIKLDGYRLEVVKQGEIWLYEFTVDAKVSTAASAAARCSSALRSNSSRAQADPAPGADCERECARMQRLFAQYDSPD
jgi:hypothetical protein